ncbi:glycosyltransferase family A protein [Planktomarina temperata]|nr:glycosyltransferase family A protein [Planktomarina temperata]
MKLRNFLESLGFLLPDLLPISVVIPIHNNENTLHRALESTVDCAEVIMICDACTDASFTIAKSFETDARVKIKCFDYKDPGPSRFLGVKLATEEYVCFLDADDEFLPGKLRKQYQTMVSRNLKWTCTAYNVVKKTEIAHVVTPPSVVSTADLWRANDIGMSTVMVQKDLLNSQLNFPSRPLEDWKLWLRLAEKENCYGLNFVGTNYYRSSNHSLKYFYHNIKNRLCYLREIKPLSHAIGLILLYIFTQIRRRM